MIEGIIWRCWNLKVKRMRWLMMRKYVENESEAAMYVGK